MLITFYILFTLAHILNIQENIPFLFNHTNSPIQQQHKILNKIYIISCLKGLENGVFKRSVFSLL